MTILILDTSQSQTILALSYQGELIDSYVLSQQLSLSPPLPFSIQTFLKKHQLSPKQLQAVALGIGPGSYTGTRVAAAVAKTLSYTLEIPLIPFCSLLTYSPSYLKEPFILALESKGASPFLLQAEIDSCGIKGINIVEANKRNNLLSFIQIFTLNPTSFLESHPEFKNHPVQKATTNLDLLSRHLHNEWKQGNTLSYVNLCQLKLLYLNILPTSSPLIEALPV